MDKNNNTNSNQKQCLNLLIVDDDVVTRDLLKEVFEKQNFIVSLAESGEKAWDMLKSKEYELVLSDIRMMNLDGMALLTNIKNQKLKSVVILMTGFGSMETAIEAIQKGAFDYISKPYKIDDIKSLIARAEKHWRNLFVSSIENKVTEPKMENIRQKTIIGKSPAIVEVFKTLARATMSNSTVLITGESGTGKELVARAIHENSNRKEKKFIGVNCGAIAESLLESELFGHMKGAFTGAMSDKKGLFEEAHLGTIFLDEIGDISHTLQIKLLRVLQENEVKPVGANISKKIDVRIITATHRNLEELVKQGKFREDLYYRLKVISIELPPLRERMGDLPELVNTFIKRYSDKNNKVISHISPEAVEILNSYNWPGNIRELEHAIEHAVALTKTTILYPEDFPHKLCKNLNVNVLKQDEVISSNIQNNKLGSLDEMEKEHILKVLKEVSYNKSKASEILGIDRATLYRKASKYGINLGG